MEIGRGDVDRVAGWIDEARPVDGRGGVTVLTGAGVSTDSGIPDFRGPDGLWTRNPEAERLATIDVYLRDPDVRRRSWRWRAQHPAWEAEPNAAHHALVDLERAGRLRAVVTQNVDGLHQQAGNDPERVVEVHGSMREVECVSCDHRGPMTEVLSRIERGEDDPDCPSCGGILKAATIYFGQALDPADIGRARQEAEDCEVFVAAGTSLQVYPVAYLPGIAAEHGARVVIVNAEPTPYDEVADAVLRGGVAEILPALVPGGDVTG